MKRPYWLCAYALLAGCSPGIDVRPNPLPSDKGIRYYRPTPYLLVEPASPEAGGKDGSSKGAALDPRGKLFKVSLQYLPDFGEEYAVKVRAGLGTSKVKLTLENGWNLTSVDQDLDSKASENITAVTNLLKAAAPNGLASDLTSRESTESSPSTPDRVIFVRASNVPIGYYESVIGRDPDSGRKQLYGFRYVGFLPFATCPIQPAGSATACCADGTMPLYGLVFEDEVMTFRPLPDLAARSGSVIEIQSSPPKDQANPPEHGTQAPVMPTQGTSPIPGQAAPLPEPFPSKLPSATAPKAAIRVF